MRKPILGSIAVAAVTLAACGGGGSQGEVADLLLDSAEQEGFELDRGCVEDVAGKLSDADADKILEAGPDSDPVLSAEGEALSNELLDCVDTDSVIDAMIAPLVAEMGEENVDIDCIKNAARDLDLSDPEDPQFALAMFECVDIDLGG
jgi:hypothetical protein